MSKEETNYFSLSLIHLHILESFLKGRGGEGEENTFYIEMKNTDDKVLIRNYGRQQSDIFKVLNDN